MARVLPLEEIWTSNTSIPFLVPYGGGVHRRRGGVQLLNTLLTSVLGIPESRLLPYMKSQTSILRIGKLHVVDFRHRNGEDEFLRDNGLFCHYLPPRRMYLKLHTLYNDKLSLDSLVARQQTGLLWISRNAEHNDRQLIGETSLLQQVRELWSKNLGASVTIFGSEPRSLAEMASLFAQSAVVVGVHGAGLSNLIFCKPDTIVVEMTCLQRFCHTVGASTSAALNLTYWSVPLHGRQAHAQKYVSTNHDELLGVLSEIAAKKNSKSKARVLKGMRLSCERARL